eukprot:SAG31_NODE_4213_length_3461_cov_1.715645_1_plen_66_part_00
MSRPNVLEQIDDNTPESALCLMCVAEEVTIYKDFDERRGRLGSLRYGDVVEVLEQRVGDVLGAQK